MHDDKAAKARGKLRAFIRAFEWKADPWLLVDKVFHTKVPIPTANLETVNKPFKGSLTVSRLAEHFLELLYKSSSTYFWEAFGELKIVQWTLLKRRRAWETNLWILLDLSDKELANSSSVLKEKSTWSFDDFIWGYTYLPRRARFLMESFQLLSTMVKYFHTNAYPKSCFTKHLIRTFNHLPQQCFKTLPFSRTEGWWPHRPAKHILIPSESPYFHWWAHRKDANDSATEEKNWI